MPIRRNLQSSQLESYRATTLTLQSGMQHACANLPSRTESNSTCRDPSSTLQKPDGAEMLPLLYRVPGSMRRLDRLSDALRVFLSIRAVLVAGPKALTRAICRRRVRTLSSFAHSVLYETQRLEVQQDMTRSSLINLRHETAHAAA
jgi:hypothetical protein